MEYHCKSSGYPSNNNKAMEYHCKNSGYPSNNNKAVVTPVTRVKQWLSQEFVPQGSCLQ